MRRLSILILGVCLLTLPAQAEEGSSPAPEKASAAPAAAKPVGPDQPPTPPGGYVAPEGLDLGAANLADPSGRPQDWVTVGSAFSKNPDAVYAGLRKIAGGDVRIVFRNGSSIRTHLEGCATTGLVVKHPNGPRVIYPYNEVEWVRPI